MNLQDTKGTTASIDLVKSTSLAFTILTVVCLNFIHVIYEQYVAVQAASNAASLQRSQPRY